jgi:hypothetical protein
MTKRTQNHLTLAGIIGGATLVVSTFGAMVNGILSLDKKVGAGATVTDSLFFNDSVLTARVEVIEKRLGVRGKKVKLTEKQPSAGLVRRVFRLLF